VFVSGPSIAVVRKYVDGIRAALVAQGRPANDVLIYAQALVVTGENEAAAKAKHAGYREHIDLEASLALLSGWTGVDFSRFAPDATVEYIDTEAGRSALASFNQADPTRVWTVQEAAQFIGLGGRGPVIVGDAVQVADELERWVEATGVDGFNLAYAVAHESMRDVVEHVVPELQKRGRYRREYARGTLREQLFGRGPRLGANHIAKRLRLDAVHAAA
jgi:alkanesulfonate monooxygenase SsuD/methylene tetrahydromethanopterin reductase-like flavin-dependent oxidoreductase (luciferase family)